MGLKVYPEQEDKDQEGVFFRWHDYCLTYLNM